MPMSDKPVTIRVVEGDLASRLCDLVVLKYADGLHGADKYIASHVGYQGKLEIGDHEIIPGRNIEAKNIMFIGTGPLLDFRYGEIRSFGRRALAMAEIYAPEIRKIATTIHGPGYGLDEHESLLALVAGFFDGVREGELPVALNEIEIVEKDPRRAARLKRYLTQVQEQGIGSSSYRSSSDSLANTKIVAARLSSFGNKSEEKIKLFVAMPFKSDYTDEYEIAISEACGKTEILCERIDKQAYVGDILEGIKKRISSYNGVIALLNESNPNVFLEIGFAWAIKKPTILLLREGGSLPFDIKGQKCIIYSSIHGLRQTLQQELVALKSDGVFDER